ncbi:hypothetical protein A7U60_g5104 [Sanghuangporus baumii]|uniref:Uncharacterized protein n=1 Tax=Sanghuangporus baumii TaxID=108892 RepID=A0A9Q5N8G6_SANBA|nr:hypothetical protein A7U60_g5104 [Sanghuangporus baumii]
MGIGVDNNVYMANDSGQDIYVMATLNPDWAIADFVFDIALLFTGIEEIKAAATAAELPATIATVRDLYEFLKIGAEILSGTVSVGTRPTEAALSLVEAFKKTSIPIAPATYKNVKEDGFLGIYLSVDGIASILGASTVSLIVMSGDGKQVAMWNSGGDDSWIATRAEKIVRSKYGTIWQQDAGAGTVDWPVASN